MLEGFGRLMTGGVGIEELRALGTPVDMWPSSTEKAFCLSSGISSPGLGIIEDFRYISVNRTIIMKFSIAYGRP